jgi:serine/threonine protein kinase
MRPRELIRVEDGKDAKDRNVMLALALLVLLRAYWKTARRINNAHVLKTPASTRQRNYLYVVSEFVEGKTLAQWMIDNPKPDIEAVRGIVEQIARGLRAFHRMEMLHQDLRPHNVMIDTAGTVKIIDFGSVRVAGVIEASPLASGNDILGTAQYTAPEYFLGEAGTTRSDLFSLGVIAYQMLTGRLPYGAEIAKTRTRLQQRKLSYRSARNDCPELPIWVDGALQKAVHPDPYKRYEALSEFIFDLRNPKDAFLRSNAAPLLERNPLLFWKFLTAFLACTVVFLLASRGK